MAEVVASFLKYVEQGGYVMPPLIASAMILWYGIGYRLFLLSRGAKKTPRSLIETFEADPTREPADAVEQAASTGVRIRRHAVDGLERQLDAELSAISDSLGYFRIPSRAIVAVAPLLGLLGTVSGMIETFSALGDMTLYSQSGGIAGGISQALLTTQFGLAIAIPGLVATNFLDRRQADLESRIDEIKSVLCGNEDAEAAA